MNTLEPLSFLEEFLKLFQSPHDEAYERITKKGYKVNREAFYATPEPPFLKNENIYVRTSDPSRPTISFLWFTYEYTTKQSIPQNSRLQRFNDNKLDYTFENIYLPVHENEINAEDVLTRKAIEHLLPQLDLLENIDHGAQYTTLVRMNPVNDTFSQMDMLIELQMALRLLAPEDETLLREIYVADKAVKTVAEQMSTSPQNVSTKSKIALKKLSKIINQRFKWEILPSIFLYFMNEMPGCFYLRH